LEGLFLIICSICVDLRANEFAFDFPAAQPHNSCPHMPETISSRLAPITLPDTQGGRLTLGTLWHDRPAVIIFLRHWG
jgi:hypothetical protein